MHEEQDVRPEPRVRVPAEYRFNRMRSRPRDPGNQAECDQPEYWHPGAERASYADRDQFRRRSQHRYRQHGYRGQQYHRRECHPDYGDVYHSRQCRNWRSKCHSHEPRGSKQRHTGVYYQSGSSNKSGSSNNRIDYSEQRRPGAECSGNSDRNELSCRSHHRTERRRDLREQHHRSERHRDHGHTDCRLECCYRTLPNHGHNLRRYKRREDIYGWSIASTNADFDQRDWCHPGTERAGDSDGNPFYRRGHHRLDRHWNRGQQYDGSQCHSDHRDVHYHRECYSRSSKCHRYNIGWN